MEADGYEPVWGCILIGGQSRRMGRPKHLIRERGQSWLERTVDLMNQIVAGTVIAGKGRIPARLWTRETHPATRLADVPGVEGPMAGVLAAMRWRREVSWLVTACDLPDLNLQALHWLLDQRKPEVWAVLPRLPCGARVEPLPGYYDFRCQPLLEELAAQRDFSLARLAEHNQVISPLIPARLASAWRNVNTPQDLWTGRSRSVRLG